MIGELVGNYEVLRQLGEGGMGAVYLAQHRLIGRRVAIKVLLPGTSTNPEMVQRFFNEARSTSAIKHAGLIDVFDFGYHNGSAFLAMEFLEGESLAARLAREGRLRPELVAAVGRQVASALGAAHAAGIVHRDLKPDNIFLVPDDEVAIGVRAKVLDFGIAKLSGDHGASFKTRTGSLMGTPAYMSPEQCRGAADVDARSDIYALGCILYELATGRTPFVHDAIGPMMMAHMIEEPPPPRQLAPGLPDALDAVIRRAMAKHADDRYPSMEAVVAALGGRTLDGMEPPLPPALFAAGTPSPTTLAAAATGLPAHAPPTPRRTRRRAIVITVAAGALAAGGVVAATLWGATPTSTAHAPPPAPATTAPTPSPVPDAPAPAAPVEDVAPPPPAPAPAPLATTDVASAPATTSAPATPPAPDEPPEPRDARRKRKHRRSAPPAMARDTDGPPAGAEAPINPDGTKDPFQRKGTP